MDKFSSLLRLQDFAKQELLELLLALRDADDFCENRYPDLSAARIKVEKIVTDLDQIFSESLAKDIELQAKADEDLANQFDGLSY
jgi:hypothetical protein